MSVRVFWHLLPSSGNQTPFLSVSPSIRFLNFLLSWLLVLLPSTFSLHVLFSFSPALSNPQLISAFSPLPSFSRGHTIAVFSALWYLWCPASLHSHYFLYIFIYYSFHPWLKQLLLSSLSSSSYSALTIMHGIYNHVLNLADNIGDSSA